MAVVRQRVALTPPYDVVIGANVVDAVCSEIAQPHVALIADEHVHALHGEQVEGALAAASKRVETYLFSGGEAAKTLHTFGNLLERLNGDGFERGSAVLALGGGITGDVAGFVAASHLRGVAFYNLPTTLLAMVDASVGGKTGVNLPQGKNLAGAFWQPSAVGIDVSFLRTLPERAFRQGAVELFKHGLLASQDLIEAVKKPEFTAAGDPDVLTDLIAQSVRVKADIVVQDEREAGERAFLNLGHTLAHALEAASGHALEHGDAVAYGLYFNAVLGVNRGFQDLREPVLEFLHWVEPNPLPNVSLEALRPYFQTDKKTRDGLPRFVLLKEIGAPFVAADVSSDELAQAWQALEELR